MKTFLCTLFLLFPPLAQKATGQDSGQSQAVYYQCDFNDGIPADFSAYDLDGETLHFSMIQAGFRQGDAWIGKREEKVSPANYYAASASKHKNAADAEPRPANDWLVTPAVHIRAADARLSWRGRSICEQGKKESRYQVLVSAKGNRPEDFTDAPLATIEAEPADRWDTHEVSLAAYAESEVYIAFVNVSTDCEILGIDDIVLAGGKGLYDLTIETPPYSYGKTAVTLEAAVTPHSDVPVTRFTAHYRCGQQEGSRTFEDLHLEKGETFRFSFEDALPVEYGDTLRYEIWADVNGRPSLDTRHGSTVALLFNPSRRTVVEEGTGMWCVYCPKGIIAMRLLREKYPESFIGVSVHYDDPLSVEGYSDALPFSGFPEAIVNRKYAEVPPMVATRENGIDTYTTLNGGLETWFLKAQAEQAIADIGLEAEKDGDKVKATVHTTFALPVLQADYRLALVMTEDRVTDESCYQANAYAGQAEVLGGFENLPAVISPYTFNEVARAIFNHWKGVEGSVPAVIEAGETYVFPCEFDLPATVRNVDDTYVVALLIDQRTGEVANAAMKPLGDPANGIRPASTGGGALSYDAASRTVRLSDAGSRPATFTLHDAAGRLLFSRSARPQGGTVSCDLARMGKGLYVVRARQGDDVRSLKILIK